MQAHMAPPILVQQARKLNFLITWTHSINMLLLDLIKLGHFIHKLLN